MGHPQPIRTRLSPGGATQEQSCAELGAAWGCVIGRWTRLSVPSCSMQGMVNVICCSPPAQRLSLLLAGRDRGRTDGSTAGMQLCCLWVWRALHALLQRSAQGWWWHGSIPALRGPSTILGSHNYARPFHHNRFTQNSCININVPKDFEQLFGKSRTNI